MKDVKIGVNLGYKVNMGNYETMDIHFEMSGTLEPGEDAEEEFERIKKWVSNKVGEEMVAARAASRTTVVRRKPGE